MSAFSSMMLFYKNSTSKDCIRIRSLHPSPSLLCICLCVHLCLPSTSAGVAFRSHRRLSLVGRFHRPRFVSPAYHLPHARATLNLRLRRCCVPQPPAAKPCWTVSPSLFRFPCISPSACTGDPEPSPPPPPVLRSAATGG